MSNELIEMMDKWLMGSREGLSDEDVRQRALGAMQALVDIAREHKNLAIGIVALDKDNDRMFTMGLHASPETLLGMLQTATEFYEGELGVSDEVKH